MRFDSPDADGPTLRGCREGAAVVRVLVLVRCRDIGTDVLRGYCLRCVVVMVPRDPAGSGAVVGSAPWRAAGLLPSPHADRLVTLSDPRSIGGS